MLSQSLLTVMINVNGNRIYEILLNYIVFNHLIWDFFCPVRRRSDVFSYTSSNIGTGFTQLATSPHVPVTEKEFRSFYFGWNYGRLNSHLGKFIFECIFLHVKCIVFELLQLLLGEKVMICSNTDIQIRKQFSVFRTKINWHIIRIKVVINFRVLSSIWPSQNSFLLN